MDRLLLARASVELSYKGAVHNAAAKIEIRERLLQTATYCGMPTEMASFKVLDAVMQLCAIFKFPR